MVSQVTRSGSIKIGCILAQKGHLAQDLKCSADQIKREDFLEVLCQPMCATLVHLKSHPPDTAWLLNIIGLMAPEHQIFMKDYVAPKTEKAAMEKTMISDPNGFFPGLP